VRGDNNTMRNRQITPDLRLRTSRSSPAVSTHEGVSSSIRRQRGADSRRVLLLSCRFGIFSRAGGWPLVALQRVQSRKPPTTERPIVSSRKELRHEMFPLAGPARRARRPGGAARVWQQVKQAQGGVYLQQRARILEIRRERRTRRRSKVGRRRGRVQN